ncbi:MAG: FAD-binding oxidoreductase [Ktedonobacterales bacterium]
MAMGVTGALGEQERLAFAGRLARELGVGQTLAGAQVATYAVQGRLPAVVARPTEIEGVAAALRLASEAGASIVPWGGGAEMDLGYPPQQCDLVLSLERLTRTLTYDPADLTITTEVGVTHATLARALAANHQTLPFDAPLAHRSTLGGTLATGFAGLRRAFYGASRDLSLGMRVVDASGTILKSGGQVVKNVSGYDMGKLYIGSLGTLGVIVEASFKLAPLPEAEATVIGIAHSLPAAQAAAETIERLAVRPSALVALHINALPELARITPGYERRALLVIRIPGAEAAVKRGIAEVEEAMRAAQVDPALTLDGSANDAFWQAANDFLCVAPDLAHPDSTHTDPSIGADGAEDALLRLSILPMESVAALEAAQTLASEHGLALAWLADLATGVIWVRLRSGGTISAVESSAASAVNATFARALIATHTALAHRWRNVVLLRCPAATKPHVALWGADPAGLELMREIKGRFDPHHLLNPGRFVGGI